MNNYIAPEMVISDAVNIAESALGKGQLFTSAVELINLTLPPPSLKYFIDGAKYLTIIKPHNIDIDFRNLVDFINNLKKNDNTETSFKVGTSYPFFNGLKKLANKSKNYSDTNISIAAGIYIKTCLQKYDEINKRSRSKYYQDVIAVRDILGGNIIPTEMLDIILSDFESAKERLITTLRTINEQNKDSSPNNNRLEFNKIKKVENVLQLLNGLRNFGCPKFKKPHQFTRKKIVKSVKIDTEYMSDNADWHLSFDKENYYIQRETPPTGSTLSLKDDLSSLRTVVDSFSARSIVSYSDASRLPLITIRKFFEYSLTRSPKVFLYSFLLLVTGIDPKRLRKLVLAEKRVSHPDHVLLVKSTKSLSYAVIGGATNYNKNTTEIPKQLSITLNIPAILLDIIERFDFHPFANIECEFKRISINFSKRNPGYRPTPDRLSRSYWLHISPHIGNDIISSIITGDIPIRFSANSKYYSIPDIKITTLWSDAINKLSEQLISNTQSKSKLRLILSKCNFAPTSYEHNIGSMAAIKPSDLSPLIKSLHELKNEHSTQATVSFGQKQLNHIIHEHNIANMLLYAILQINLLLRQVGDKTTARPTSRIFGTWLREKDSSHFRERRLTTLSDITIKTLKETQNSVSFILDIASSMDLSINIKEDVRKRNLAIYIHQSKNNKLNIFAMTSKHFFELIDKFKLTHLFDFKRNSIRHMLASELIGKVPQPYLNALLGHETDGIDIFSPFSSSSGLYTESGTIIDNLLEELFLEPILCTKKV